MRKAVITGRSTTLSTSGEVASNAVSRSRRHYGAHIGPSQNHRASHRGMIGHIDNGNVCNKRKSTRGKQLDRIIWRRRGIPVVATLSMPRWRRRRASRQSRRGAAMTVKRCFRRRRAESAAIGTKLLCRRQNWQKRARNSEARSGAQ